MLKETNILLINDIVGYGKVASSVMIPILSYKGFCLYNLPTAIVSNTLNYESFQILETTEYMENTLRIWDQLGFSFDAISTGFIVTERQMEIISEFCAKQSKKGVLIFNDPIMGDNGKLYDGIPEETVGYMRGIVAHSDVTMPNYTEACLLTDTPIKTSVAKEEIHAIIDKLRTLGAKSAVVTSIDHTDGKLVAGYDQATEQYFYIPYEEIPVYFPGTGDIFSAVLISQVMGGSSLPSSTEKAMSIVKRLVEENRQQSDKYRGISIERCLSVFDE
ncbi:MAG: pyridoxamine kinase [Peptostreptococcaceae bacterium]|nr:pyridoxamine kinase [Peptostreptococcaceae bacterium]